MSLSLRDGAVHGEHAVGRDETHAGVLRILERPLELVHVVVRIAQPARLAEPDAVDDARVIQRIADDRIALIEQRLEQSAVGVEARGIENRVFHAEVAAQALLELAVHALRSANEAHRRDTVAVAPERIVRGLEHRRVIREPEVIVGAQIDHLAAVGEPDDGSLRRSDDALALQQSCGLERLRLALEPFTKILEHSIPSNLEVDGNDAIIAPCRCGV